MPESLRSPRVTLPARRYEDTAGVEVDIATSVAFKQVAERCAALRFVVLIDCHTFSVDRGGAMRRVAALVGAFVRKFLPSKLAFSFIFTKTDALLGGTDSRAAVLTKLKQVLIETLQGTNDGDQKEFINWLITCIHYDNSLVDVYHPAFSEVDRLRSAIETFEKPSDGTKPPTTMALRSPRTDVRCGLTPKAESRIKLDLDAQLDELDIALVNGCVASAAKIVSTLSFLQEQVDKPYVHAAHEKALKAWGEHGARVALGRTYALIACGLGRSDEHAFDEEQGREALRSLGTLRLFERHPVPNVQDGAAEKALVHLRRGLSEQRRMVEAGLCSVDLTASGVDQGHSLSQALAAFTHAMQAHSRLAVWARVHAEFEVTAEVSLAALNTHAQRLIEYACAPPPPPEGTPAFVLAMMQLDELCRSIDSTRIAEPEALEAALEACKDKLTSLLSHQVCIASDWAANANGASPVGAQGDSVAVDGEGSGRMSFCLEPYLASLTRVEGLAALFANHSSSGGYPQMLNCSTLAARGTILGHAKTQMLTLREEVDQLVGAYDARGMFAGASDNGKIESLLCMMRQLSAALTSAQHATIDSGRLYEQTVSSACEPARRLLTRAQERCERELREIEPLPSAAAHSDGIAQITACAWLDEHLGACGLEAFVADGIEKLLVQYDRYGERAASAALKALERYLGSGGGISMSSSDAAAFREAASVLEQLCGALGSAIPRVGQQADKFSTSVHAVFRKWSRNGQRFAALAHPEAGTLGRFEVDAATMEEALCACQTILGSGLKIEALFTLNQQVQERLRVVSSSLVDLFAAAPGRAAERSAALQTLHTLRAKGLGKVTEHLPDIGTLRAGVAAEMQAKATAAREAVNASAGDADSAEKALVELEELSRAFREFDFGQTAATTASDLRQTLDLRCAKLDETLQESLSSGRFEYVHKYIAPLIGARDPLKQEKLSKTLVAARDVLQQKYDGAGEHVADASRVAEAIGVLDDAAKHLGTALQEQLDFDASTLSATLRKRAAACLKRHVDSLDEAISQLSYAQVMEGEADTKDYLQAVEQLLVPPAPDKPVLPPPPRPPLRSSRRHPASAAPDTSRVGSSSLAQPPALSPFLDVTNAARSAVRRATECLNDVDRAVRALIEHVRGTDLGRDDRAFRTRPLCEKLSKLKMAGALGGSLPDTAAQLMARYEHATRELSQALSTKLEEVDSKARSEHIESYGLKVFSYVQGELRHGLADHVALRVDVDTVLTELRGMADETAGRMQMDRFTIPYVDSTVKPTLDKLKRGTGGWFAWWSRRQYEEEKQSFNAGLLGLLDATRAAALQTHKYDLAGQRVLLLQHIFQTLREHLTPSVRSKWDELKQGIFGAFRNLCEGVNGALAQGDASSFELQLRKLHLFEEGLSHIDAPKLKSAATAVHDAICAWTDGESKKLLQQLEDAVELAAAAAAVQRLRQVGRVLVTTWTMYTELADAAGRHSKNDASLHRVAELVSQFFGGEARAAVGISFAVLELDDGATRQEVNKAYKAMSKRYHPDKRQTSASREPAHAMQQRVVHAKQALEDDATRERFARETKMPFAEQIRSVARTILVRLGELLEEQEYAMVRQELAALEDVPKLLALVDGNGNKECLKPRKDAHAAVKRHMTQMRADVNRLWEERKFKELNSRLNAVDAADKALGGFEGLYDPAWARNVRSAVETEIESQAAGARTYLNGKSEDEAEGFMKDFALKLILLGRILDELPRYKDFCRVKMAGLLDTVHEQGSWSFCYLFKLGMLLSQGKIGELDSSGNVAAEDDRIGKTIVAEFKHFKDVTTMVWNEEVTQKDVRAVVGEAEAWRVSSGMRRTAKLDEGSLIRGFELYEKEYQKKFTEWTAGHLTPEELAHQAVSQAAAVQPGSSRHWNDAVLDVLPTLLARVFCFFTISKSGESYTRLLEQADKFGDDAEEGGGGGGLNMDNVLLKPHCTQVLTVLQMLGYGATNVGDALQRQLMQIRTGEGKSIILGACSTVLALLGFRVRCVCYSDYLSGRDYDLFRELFEAFSVTGLVTYSTIGEYSEDVTKRKGDIRALTEALLLGRPVPQPAAGSVSSSSSSSSSALPSLPPDKSANGAVVSKKNRGKKRSADGAVSDRVGCAVASAADEAPEILLVDEVDIFFGEDFYGQTHNQVVQIDVPEAVNLLRAVWKLRHGSAGRPLSYGALLRAAKASAEYRATLSRFLEWQDIIEREVEAMCADSLCFDDPKPHYDAALDRLGYRVMDTIDYESAVYGYRTAFAHLHHADNGGFRDPASALKRALKLQVPCGKFSYANIQPECILGVSGTLAALGEYETQVMERYGIQLYASMPSVYGETQLKFDHAGGAISIEASVDSFHRQITDEANRKVREGRAVIVFFEAGRLEKYTSSPYFKKVPHANVLHESLDPKARDYVIRKAATHGQATFASEAFGRGTDFFCKDSKLTNAGGVHVLQTFLALKKADEVQIKGRTARQGKQGTYALVLLQADLTEKFNLRTGWNANVAQRDLYDTLERARNAMHATACKATETALHEATRVDKMTHAYFDVVLQSGTGDRSPAASLMHALYKELRGKVQVGGASSYHVIFLTDKSGSMTSSSAVPGQMWCNFGYHNRLGCALEACDRFVRMRDAAGATDKVSVIMFDNGVTTALNAADLHAELITDLVRTSRWTYGGTNFTGAFGAAEQVIRRDANGLPFLIMFLTDGHGYNTGLDSIVDRLRQKPDVSMKALSFGDGCDTRYLTNLAGKFGENGEYLAAIDGVQLVENFEAAAAELSHTGRRNM